MFTNIKYWIVFLVILSSISGDEAKASLTFVIDNTISMANEIDQVLARTKDIFDAVLNSNASQIDEFIIVTFNDPVESTSQKAATLEIKTKNREDFTTTLNEIEVGGGYDCPEMAMTGIELALEESKPNSLFYVFTDASAKDYFKYDIVKSLAQQKSIQVTFLLTGKCPDKKEEFYTVYDRLAAVTSGQVFNIQEQEISKIIEYILVNIKSKRTVLLQKTYKDYECKNNYTFTVDSKMWDILISKSAHRELLLNDLAVFGPGGKVEIEDFIQTRNTSLVKIKGETGKYNLYIKDCHDVTIIVSASTSLNFEHGFSSTKPSSLDETSRKPIANTASYLAIALDNNEGDVTLKTVILRDINDVLVKELSLKLIDKNRQFYVTELFTPPNVAFKIVVNGLTRSKETITRLSLTTIEYYDILVNLRETPATVIILDTKEVLTEYDKPLMLKCKISGYPRPRITWENENHIAFTSFTVNQIAPYEYTSTLHITHVNGKETFTCKAKNFVEDSDFVTVKTKGKFNVVEYPKDVTVEYGKSVKLYCKIDAIPPASITWYQGDKIIKNNDHMEIINSSDGSSLILKNAQPRLTGKYYVKAGNSLKEVNYEFYVTVSGTEVPKIDKNVSNYTIGRESSVDILCRVIQGKPEPVISWSFDRGPTGKFRKLKEIREAVHIDRVREEHVGTYKCKAANEIGTDNHNMKLSITYRPTAKIRPKENYKSRQGEQVKLECLVAGSPNPVVRWFREDVEIKSGGKYKIYRDHTLSFTGTVEDSGVYTCKANNSLDTIRSSVNVLIYEPVKIEIPENSVIQAELLSTLVLPCRVSGRPTPRVQWFYYRFGHNTHIPTKLKCDESNNLTLKYIQLVDEGYYVCTADNQIHQDIFTFTVTVPAPASIIPNFGSRNIHVVEGDLLFKLKCAALGSPKPTITWIFNGFSITESKRYEILKDGTLLVRNATLKSKGTYTCIARNVHRNDTLEYEVDVHPYPPIQENPERILLSEGENKHKLYCGIKSNKGDLVRWFKDGRLIEIAENLILVNVTKNDAGYYTCRCSTKRKSYSFHKIILVGREPKFLTEVNSTVPFQEGAEAILDCSASGEPPPTTKWWRDDVQIPEISTSRYSFIMNNNNIGQNIMCSVSNEFNIKEIKRNFHFNAGDCLMKLEDDFTARQPILATGIRKRQWPIFPTSNGTLRIRKLKKFSLLCPESFITYDGRKYGRNILTTSCVDDSMFELEGEAVHASKITCDKPVKPLAKALHDVKCLGHNTIRLYVGFDFQGSFLSVFNVCFDNKTKIPLFVEHGMHKEIADTLPKYIAGYTKGRHFHFDFDDIYDCRNQVDAISSLSEPLKIDDKCCFGRRQLVNPRDVLPGISQVATYHYMNIVPQWSTCGNENWDEAERRVRTFALNLNYTISIWTGATSAWPNVSAIYLKDKMNQRLPVPQYIWKVVKNQLAIVQINVPALTFHQASSYTLCKNICDEITWMRNDQWQDVDKGFIFCCKIKEFEIAFEYEGVFD